MLTTQRLRELLHYDPATGISTNIAPRKKVVVGSVAGSLRQRLLDDRPGPTPVLRPSTGLAVHDWRVAGATDRPPERQPRQQRFSNLRDAERAINQQNMRRPLPGTASGLLGAFKKRDRWESRLRAFGQVIRLGTFDTAEEAHAAYLQAKRKHQPGCTI